MRQKERIANDYYPTPDPIVLALLNRTKIEGKVFEPCAGHGAIAAHFPNCATNDPTPSADYAPSFTLDATDSKNWELIAGKIGGIDWVVTNPPYGQLASPIASNALVYAREGVAMLLRLNWLEPCKDRRELLLKYSDNLTQAIAISPRPRFRADTSGSDSITVAWFVWRKSWSWREKGIDCPFEFLTDWRN